MGPDHLDPAASLVPYTLSLHTASNAHCLLAELNAFRRANVRVFLSLVGNQQYYRDANGFNYAMWKARVDRFKNLDLAPYVADGTILANYILDEPNDQSNWNGHLVSAQVVDQLGQYSKSIWPTMPTMVRTYPSYLQGYHFQYVDAIRFHYLIRFGPIDDYLASNIAGANALGLKIVGGLNVLNGGDKDTGIPGQAPGRNGMSPEEIRTWGAKFLQAAPNMCGFLLWMYDPGYFHRPEIQAAIADLAKLAASYPKQSCAR
jgi:hypothetical protein